MNKSVKKNSNSINLNDEAMKLILKHNINFKNFKYWYNANKEKIQNSKYLTEEEKLFKSWIIKPNPNISKLVLFYKTQLKMKLIYKILK